MEDNKPYASSLTTKAIALYKVDNENKPYINLASMATHFQFFEDIFCPAYSGTLVVIDTGENLISSMPIQGNEKIVIEVEDAFGNNYSYDFRVWTVANRISADRRQIYTLGLISKEGLDNERIKLATPRQGVTSTVVQKLLNEKLKVPTARINSEHSRTSCKYIPKIQTSVFSFIRNLQLKTIPKKDHVGHVASNKKAKGGTSTGGDSEIGEGAQIVRDGGAGYVFYQSVRDGYSFVSFDGLVSKESIGSPFIYSPAKVEDQNPNKIQEIVYDQEINMMKKLREGSYSSLTCFFNINTGKYEERLYSVENTWNEMVHLGSQTGLPYGQCDQSKTPTRVMSTIVNNEFWYTGGDKASDDQKFLEKDYQQIHLQQALGRAGILFTQQLTISLTGHLELAAGDIIDVRIPDQKAESIKDEVWDQENSGYYLVRSLNHQFDIVDNSVYTVLSLIRDSQGIKNKESKIA